VADSVWPGGLSPFRTGFLKVALFISGAWVDVPMTELSEDGVQIKRGRGDEGGKTDPGRLSFSLKDPTGKYSPRHPSSPYYGLIGRGTKVRVQVELTAGTVLDRFYGEVVTWEPRWTKKGAPSARVDVEAAGLLRKLGQGPSPLRSTMFRHETTWTGSTSYGYWPLERGRLDGALRPQRGVTRSLVVEGKPKYAAYGDLPSSEPLPTVGNSRITARPNVYGDLLNQFSQARFVVRVPNGTTNGAVLVRLNCWDSTATLDLTYSTASSGTLSVAGTTLVTGVDDVPVWVTIAARNISVGPTLDWTATAYLFGSTVASNAANTAASTPWGGISSVVVNPNRSALGDVAVGHIHIATSPPLDPSPFNAYRGEQAHVRVARLCTENGLTSSTLGLASSEPMGYQLPNTLLALLRECEETDGGFLYEPLSATNFIEYRTLASLFSQTPVTVTYVENMLQPFEPSEDDANTRNDVTVTRAGGGSYTVTQTSGPLGTAAVGTYDEDVTLSLANDADALQQAGWRVSLGTTDEARWPQIGVDLAEASPRPDGRAPRMSLGTRSAFLGLRLGDRLDVTGLPAWLPPFDVSQLVQGYTETIKPDSYRLVFNCAPARPYRVAFWSEGTSRDRYSGDGTTTAATVNPTDTTFSVTPPGLVRWTTTETPFEVVVNGERMRIGTVAAFSGGTQTFSNVTRALNGVRKTHAAGSAVTLADPCYYGL